GAEYYGYDSRALRGAGEDPGPRGPAPRRGRRPGQGRPDRPRPAGTVGPPAARACRRGRQPQGGLLRPLHRRPGRRRPGAL
ncbi:MAG: hypothetical protein AVDCRST_MAG22-249, partial [uncultured Rubrobacteraceae bacterium]